MPAKAAKDNISGDKLSGFITYRADETFNASVGASLSDYSDDNQRLAVFSAAEKQLCGFFCGRKATVSVARLHGQSRCKSRLQPQ